MLLYERNDNNDISFVTSGSDIGNMITASITPLVNEMSFLCYICYESGNKIFAFIDFFLRLHISLVFS